MSTCRVITKRKWILSCPAHAFCRKARVGWIKEIGGNDVLKMGHTRGMKSRKFRAAQHKVSKVDRDAFTPPQFPRHCSRSIPQPYALHWAHVHQIPGMEIFMGGGLEDALQSLRKTVASRTDGDGIDVLERTDRPVLVEKGVVLEIFVRRFSADLEALHHQLLNSLDESCSVKGCGVGLRQVDYLMLQAIHDKVPVLELTHNDRRIQEQLNRGCRKRFW